MAVDKATSTVQFFLQASNAMRILVALPFLLAAPAFAQDGDYEEYYDGEVLVALVYDYYPVTGSSLQEVQDDMGANGPQGFWAYTAWNVSWTGDCEIRVDLTMTLPALDEDADLYDEEFAEWDRMIAALEEHEFGHGASGIGFAHDIEALGCDVQDVAAVQAPWLQNDIDYDAETNHGIDTGATLSLQ